MGKKWVNVRAFTLIELVVIFAIVSLLVAFAIPSYQDYVVSSKVGTSTQIIEPFKTSVLKQYINGTVFGTSTAVLLDSSSPSKPKYLTQVLRGDYGCVELEYDLQALGLDSSGAQILTLVYCPIANVGAEVLDWNCGYSSDTTVAYQKYIPLECRQLVTQDTNL